MTPLYSRPCDASVPPYCRSEKRVIMLIFLAIIIWGVSTWAGREIGISRGRATQGLLLGFFLSLIGLLIIYMLPARPISTSSTGRTSASANLTDRDKVKSLYDRGVISDVEYSRRISELRSTPEDGASVDPFADAPTFPQAGKPQEGDPVGWYPDWVMPTPGRLRLWDGQKGLPRTLEPNEGETY